jgi:hypothetical protein
VISARLFSKLDSSAVDRVESRWKPSLRRYPRRSAPPQTRPTIYLSTMASTLSGDSSSASRPLDVAVVETLKASESAQNSKCGLP